MAGRDYYHCFWDHLRLFAISLMKQIVWIVFVLCLVSCHRRQPLVEPVQPTQPTTTPTTTTTTIVLPPSPLVSTSFLDFIVEAEGYASPPEAPDELYSGVTLAIGYDVSENEPKIVQQDWVKLPNNQPQRLADAHPYKGKVAKAHIKDYRDILVPKSRS